MADAFSEGDIALLDQSARARTDIEPSAYYVVKSGNGGIIRRIHISGGNLYLIPEDCAHRSSGWQRIPLEGRLLTQLLRARAHIVTPIYEWDPR